MAAKRRRPSNEDEERAFWSEQDSTELVDWTQAERVTLPDLKPSLKTISLRLPSFMLDEIKRLAHKRDVPYQSLIKLFLAERVKREIEDDAA
jgi:predicted DNA binding CopG/RHH family protein